MSTHRFQRRIEDFVCEHCGFGVKGNGYTNHCSKCLWSKHVDVYPGDRAAECRGLMEPIDLEGSSPEYVIVHRCVKCDHERRNMVASDDDNDALVTVAKKRRTRMMV